MRYSTDPELFCVWEVSRRASQAVQRHLFHGSGADSISTTPRQWLLTAKCHTNGKTYCRVGARASVLPVVVRTRAVVDVRSCVWVGFMRAEGSQWIANLRAHYRGERRGVCKR